MMETSQKIKKDTAKKISEKGMEEEIKNLQKHMGGLVKTIIDLKHRVETLEKGANENHKKEIEYISENQNVIDKAIAANKNAIQNIDKEIHTLSQSKRVGKNTIDKKIADKAIEENGDTEKSDVVNELKARKCRYFNRGYCKYTSKCRFFHPGDICQTYLDSHKCIQKECPLRHPKQCKWVGGNGGCKRQNCAYLHGGLPAEGNNVAAKAEFKCEGCKSIWNKGEFVVKHMIQNIQTYFCLNCEDWIKEKEKVLVSGWSLFDEAGNLRHDV